jgi:NitT/TauT family transport system permease protein
MIFVTLGLGQLLMMGRDLNDISQVMAVMLLIMLAGFSCDRLLFGPLERRLRRCWGVAESQ